MQQKRQHIVQQPQTGMLFTAHHKHHGRPLKNIAATLGVNITIDEPEEESEEVQEVKEEAQDEEKV